jgi:hypothetical protein
VFWSEKAKENQKPQLRWKSGFFAFWKAEII